MRRSFGTTTRAALRALRKPLHVAVAMLLFAALLQAGNRYFYCSSMEEVRQAPCCARESSPTQEHQAQIRDAEPDCCVAVVASRLPAAAPDEGSCSPPPAGVVGVLPVEQATTSLTPSSRPTPRACGPPSPPTSREARARLQVFLI